MTRSSVSLLFLIATVALSAQVLHAQKTTDPKWVELEGTVTAVDSEQGLLRLKEAKKGQDWVAQIIPGTSQVKIEGTAERDFLRAGLYVKFTGETDKKGTLQEEIKEITIASPPSKNAVGLFAPGADKNASPVIKMESGAYDVRGKITSVDHDALIVQAGRKISGKLATDAKILVRAADIALVQPHDKVKAKGSYRSGAGPDPFQSRPGAMIATELTIQCAKPLAPLKKPGATAARRTKPSAP